MIANPKIFMIILTKAYNFLTCKWLVVLSLFLLQQIVIYN